MEETVSITAKKEYVDKKIHEEFDIEEQFDSFTGDRQYSFSPKKVFKVKLYGKDVDYEADNSWKSDSELEIKLTYFKMNEIARYNYLVTFTNYSHTRTMNDFKLYLKDVHDEVRCFDQVVTSKSSSYMVNEERGQVAHFNNLVLSIDDEDLAFVKNHDFFSVSVRFDNIRYDYIWTLPFGLNEKLEYLESHDNVDDELIDSLYERYKIDEDVEALRARQDNLELKVLSTDFSTPGNLMALVTDVDTLPEVPELRAFYEENDMKVEEGDVLYLLDNVSTKYDCEKINTRIKEFEQECKMNERKPKYSIWAKVAAGLMILYLAAIITGSVSIEGCAWIFIFGLIVFYKGKKKPVEFHIPVEASGLIKELNEKKESIRTYLRSKQTT